MIYYKDMDKEQDLKGLTEHWDEIAKVPYLADRNGKLMFTFDNAKSLGYKCEYAKRKGLKGVMSWFYEADDGEKFISARGNSFANTIVRDGWEDSDAESLNGDTPQYGSYLSDKLNDMDDKHAIRIWWR